jgi:hypothetical protein
MRYLALNMCNVMYIEKKCAGLMIDVVSSVHLKLAAKPARSAVKTVLDYTKKKVQLIWVTEFGIIKAPTLYLRYKLNRLPKVEG